MDFAGAIIGLGNPGPQYTHTRHNIGFDFVDVLLDYVYREGGTVNEVSGQKFSCQLWRCTLPRHGIWLVAKPLTFMNCSGECVQPLLAWHRVSAQQLHIVHDELDIEPGQLRFKFGGGNAGHNGLKSITERLGTPDFHRLRIGIGRPPHRGDVTNWVLGRPDKEQLPALLHALDDALRVFLFFLQHEDVKATAKFAQSMGPAPA